MFFYNRQKSKIGQNVLFIETKGCMAEQHHLSGVGIIRGHGKLRTNPRFIEVDVELDDGSIRHFVEDCAGVIKLNSRTWFVYT